jgi:hypothetical protein
LAILRQTVTGVIYGERLDSSEQFTIVRKTPPFVRLCQSSLLHPSYIILLSSPTSEISSSFLGFR